MTAFRQELCDQVQRLGGIVTIAELIDLALLLRPASTTLDVDRQRKLASAKLTDMANTFTDAVGGGACKSECSVDQVAFGPW